MMKQVHKSPHLDLIAINVRSVRPGFGLHPKYLSEILGKKVNRDLEVGDRMWWEVVEKLKLRKNSFVFTNT